MWRVQGSSLHFVRAAVTIAWTFGWEALGGAIDSAQALGLE